MAKSKARSKDKLRGIPAAGTTGLATEPTTEENQTPTNNVGSLSQEHLRMVWEGVQSNMPMTGEQVRTAKAMREHPEYYDLWARLGDLSKKEIERDGTNPIMHITLHSVVENQVAAGDPPEVRRVIASLVRRGLSRHEAVHGVARLFAEELYPVLFEQSVFDRAAYVAKVRRLLRG